MIESLHNANGADETRIRRAFKWVVTFRDFPAGSYQTVNAGSMMTEAVTLFTKGRAEFRLGKERRRDRVPGILSSEEPFAFKDSDGDFRLDYVENTTRVCIPSIANKGRVPNLSKIELKSGKSFEGAVGFKAMVCLGAISVQDRLFSEEQSFEITTEAKTITALEDTILLDFTKA